MMPPYQITDEMLTLIAKVMERLGQLANVNDLSSLPRLQRANRIKAIHSSLAIEHNSLSITQVANVISGKRVLGSPSEIQEVKGAIAAYNLLQTLDPFSVNDLLAAHKVMTQGLIEDAGKFRTAEEGVFEGDKCIHIAPPPNQVPSLISNLFSWLKASKAHPLITSSVFHYELEFIHPFRDGNGRIGRLWQTAILSHWKPLFAWIPVESIIIDKQEEYYRAILLSTIKGLSNPFIIFMLQVVLQAVEQLLSDSKKFASHISDKVRRLINVAKEYPMTAVELMKLLNLKSRDSFRKNYLHPALEAGLIAMTHPQQPTSRNQMYYKKW